MANAFHNFPRTGNVSNTTVRVLNAVVAIKIEDQDDIVLELGPIGTAPFVKEQDCRRAGLSEQWKIVLTVSLSADVFANKV